MHRDGAEEAKSCGGTMLAMEHHGKLRTMHQRMHGGLRNVTSVNFAWNDPNLLCHTPPKIG